DIDGLSGVKDLNNVDNFDVCWNGGTGAIGRGGIGGFLGSTGNHGSGVQLVTVDGDSFSNDLLLTSKDATVNGAAWAGAVYLIKNINSLSGGKDLISTENFDVSWQGDTIMDNVGGGNFVSRGSAVQLVNVDAGSYSNDLLITAQNKKIDGVATGAVYLIKDIDGLSGVKDLNNVDNFDVRWNGGSASDFLGYTIVSNRGVQLVNIDNGFYSNDLLVSAVKADVNGKIDNGVVYFIQNITPAPDVNLLRVGGSADASVLGPFSYVSDGNLTVDFNVMDSDSNNLLRVDLNYSSSVTDGSGTVIVDDLNLSALPSSGALNCQDTNFDDSTQCSIDWNISGVPDGNYYLLMSVTDGVSSDFNASDTNFMIDNTFPSTSWDGNHDSWQVFDSNVHLTCSDGAGSGCQTTSYRLDVNSNSGISFGSWQTYDTNILISADGNWAVDFNSMDIAGNMGDTNSFYVLVDTANPTVTITSGEKSTSTQYALTFSGSDVTAGIKQYWVSSNNVNWSNVGTVTSYTFSIDPNESLPASHVYYVKSQDFADNNSSVVSIVVVFEASGSGSLILPSSNYCWQHDSSTVCDVSEFCPGEWLSVDDTNRCCSVQCEFLTGQGPVTEEDFVLSMGKMYSVEMVEAAVVVLDRLDKQIELVSQRIATSNDVQLTRVLKVNQVVVAEGIKYHHSFSLEVKNVSEKTLKDVEIIEEVSKRFASNASLISSDREFVVLKEDPVIKFLIGDLVPNQTKKIEYAVNVDFNQPLISEQDFDSLSPPLAVISLDSNDLCWNVYCNDFNPCTTDYCEQGFCQFKSKENGVSCGDDLVCENEQCVQKINVPVVILKTELLSNFYALILAIAGLFMIGVGYFYLKKKKDNKQAKKNTK
ncbi:hypothetical protein KJ972_00510, partial [Candidatus Micrarchaeota archaeon]|nr:hypothetical protein [Candidatus Micrarchaeota archaeon]